MTYQLATFISNGQSLSIFTVVCVFKVRWYMNREVTKRKLIFTAFETVFIVSIWSAVAKQVRNMYRARKIQLRNVDSLFDVPIVQSGVGIYPHGWRG